MRFSVDLKSIAKNNNQSALSKITEAVSWLYNDKGNIYYFYSDNTDHKWC